MKDDLSKLPMGNPNGIAA